MVPSANSAIRMRLMVVSPSSRAWSRSDVVAAVGPRRAAAEAPRAGLDEIGEARALLLVERVVNLGERADGRLAHRLHRRVVPREHLAEQHLVEALRAHRLGDVAARRRGLAPRL